MAPTISGGPSDASTDIHLCTILVKRVSPFSCRLAEYPPTQALTLPLNTEASLKALLETSAAWMPLLYAQRWPLCSHHELTQRLISTWDGKPTSRLLRSVY